MIDLFYWWMGVIIIWTIIIGTLILVWAYLVNKLWWTVVAFRWGVFAWIHSKRKEEMPNKIWMKDGTVWVKEVKE